MAKIKISPVFHALSSLALPNTMVHLLRSTAIAKQEVIYFKRYRLLDVNNLNKKNKSMHDYHSMHNA
jgi:hypothetical protein